MLKTTDGTLGHNVRENKFGSIPEDRLNFVGNVGSGEIHFCEGTENLKRFIRETVANILASDAQHIVICFRRTVAIKKAKHIVRHIGIAVRRDTDQTQTIEAIYEVPTDLFLLLKKENSFTEKERLAVIRAFLEQLDALLRVLPMKENLVEYLHKKLRSWDREWIENAIAFNTDTNKDWEIPIIVTIDGIEKIKRLVQQLTKLAN